MIVEISAMKNVFFQIFIIKKVIIVLIYIFYKFLKNIYIATDLYCVFNSIKIKKIKKVNSMVQLLLGSANFGSKYGLENKKINKSKLINELVSQKK